MYIDPLSHVTTLKKNITRSIRAATNATMVRMTNAVPILKKGAVSLARIFRYVVSLAAFKMHT
jgi:hypothetical protein